MKALHIDSGISIDSVSRVLTAAIVERLLTHKASTEIIYRDLIEDPLPYMNLKTLPSAHPASLSLDILSEEEGVARRKTDTALEEFLAADLIVLGVPMYNFGISAQLKSWLDAIVIPGKTFTYAAGGSEGLAGSKRVILAVSRGGFYGEHGFPSSLEHAESYVHSVLSFIGICKPEVILAEGVAQDRIAAFQRGRAGIELLTSHSPA